MKILVDTNIFLEIILEQEKIKDAKDLLNQTVEHDFFISDYSFHSIGLLLFRKQLHNVFWEFIDDMVIRSGLIIASLDIEDMKQVIEVSKKFTLDFDDAYQYTVAKKYGLVLVSFDEDFNRTDLGKKFPSEIKGI